MVAWSAVVLLPVALICVCAEAHADAAHFPGESHRVGRNEHGSRSPCHGGNQHGNNVSNRVVLNRHWTRRLDAICELANEHVVLQPEGLRHLRENLLHQRESVLLQRDVFNQERLVSARGSMLMETRSEVAKVASSTLDESGPLPVAPAVDTAIALIQKPAVLGQQSEASEHGAGVHKSTEADLLHKAAGVALFQMETLHTVSSSPTLVVSLACLLFPLVAVMVYMCIHNAVLSDTAPLLTTDQRTKQHREVYQRSQLNLCESRAPTAQHIAPPMAASCAHPTKAAAAPTVQDAWAAYSDGISISSGHGSDADAYLAACKYPLASVVSCGPATSVANMQARRRLESQGALDYPASRPAAASVRSVTPDGLPLSPRPMLLPSQSVGTRRHLCPKLVVPHGMEFTFAVRAVISRERQQTSFSIVNLEGKPLWYVMVRELSYSTSQCGIYLELLTKEPMAHVRTSMLHDGQHDRFALPEICSPDGEVYCRLEVDVQPGVGMRQQKRYVLRDVAGEQLLAFSGNFTQKAISGLAASGAVVCRTRRCIIDADNAPHAPYYEVQVGPYVDAGMVLCGLLAIDKLEGDDLQE